LMTDVVQDGRNRKFKVMSITKLHHMLKSHAPPVFLFQMDGRQNHTEVSLL